MNVSDRVLKRLLAYYVACVYQRCTCDNSDCLVKVYGGKYYIVEFRFGPWAVINWLSNS